MMEPRFSVLLGCYGDYPDYSLRAVDSVLQADDATSFEVHVGCSACGLATITALRQRLDAGKIASLIECRRNINKDPMMRLLLDLARAPYALWLDDDSHVFAGWDTAVREQLATDAPFDCAGHLHFTLKTEEYREFLRQRPWFRGDDAYLDPADHGKRTIFPIGSFFLARTEFLRQHNFPDREMVKKLDDVLLGDLISQQHGRLIFLSPAVRARMRASDGDRRGEGEGPDGWILRPAVRR